MNGAANVIGVVVLSLLCACTNGHSAAVPTPKQAKMTVFEAVEPGQVLMFARMPDLGHRSFICVIARSDNSGEFVGQLEADARAPIEIRGPAKDMYTCTPNKFQPGDEVRLISKVRLARPLGVTGQVQVAPGGSGHP